MKHYYYLAALLRESVKEVEDYQQLQKDMLRFKKSIVVAPIEPKVEESPKILLMSTEEKKEVADVLNEAKNPPMRVKIVTPKKVSVSARKISKITALVAIIILTFIYLKSIINFLINNF